jgi:hypothetical protein
MSSRNIMVSLAAIAGGASIFFALRGRRNTSGALFRWQPAIRPLSITDGIGALE